jgi:hypothetical protein
LFNIVDENDFLNKILNINLVPLSYFPLESHYPSLLNDMQVWNINTWTINEDGYKSFIYLPIMDGFHPMIYLFNSTHKRNSSMQNDIYPYEIIHFWTIHPCRWIKITLSYKLNAPNFGFKFMHKPSSLPYHLICLIYLTPNLTSVCFT